MAKILGSTGNDNITTGTTGNDTVITGVGNDTILASGGSDSINAGYAASASYWRYGYNDRDTVSYANSGAARIVADLQAGTVKKYNATGTLLGTDTVIGVDILAGTTGNDSILGRNRWADFEEFRATLGNDTINGRGGLDLVKYTDFTRVVVNLAAGSVNKFTGGTGTSAAGADTLLEVEFVTGTNGADSYDATGFGGASVNFASDGDGFNVYAPQGGNDTIKGNGETVLNYDGVGGALSLSLAALTTTTLPADVLVEYLEDTGSSGFDAGLSPLASGISGLRGGNYNDTLVGGGRVNSLGFGASGTNSGDASYERFRGNGGDDFIDGGSGMDRAEYGSTETMSQGIVVKLAQGLVSGDPIVVGTDTLRGIEVVQGTYLDDVFDAIGFTLNTASPTFRSANSGDLRIGAPAGESLNSGAFNEFRVTGGNDTVMGNGATRLSFTALGVEKLTGPMPSIIASFDGVSADGVTFGEAWYGLTDGGLGTVQFSGVYGIQGGVGNDSLTGNVGFQELRGYYGNDTLSGGDGNDRLFGYSAGSASPTNYYTDNDWLDGGAGNDMLSGDFGRDTLFGGEGNDWLDGGLGDDLIDGGAGGFDTVSYRSASAGVQVDLSTGMSLGATGNDTLLGIETVEDSNGNDGLLGNGSSNWFRLGKGDDSVNGGDGSDVAMYEDASASVSVNLLAGSATGASIGNDTLVAIEAVHGSGWNDTITLGHNASGSYVFARAGADWMQGGNADDVFHGGSGNDTIDGGANAVGGDTASYGDESFEPVNGTYLSELGVQASLATGTARDNWGHTDTLLNIENLEGSSRDDTLTGSAGANRLAGNAGNDSLDGAAGNDQLLGGAGNDTLLGGEGDDSFDAGEGNDSLAGGAGNDVVNYDTAAAAVGVNLVAGTASGMATGTDTLAGIEAVTGSGWNDTITLGHNASGSFAMARAGNDTVTGGSGNDYLTGGSGADRLDGGAGIDTANYGDDSGEFINAKALSGLGVVASLATGTARDNWGDTDTLLNIENLDGSALADTLTGSNADNYLAGNAGNDAIDGGDGNDGLNGGDGNDTLLGGVGNDWFTGGAGNDSLLGGDGDDWLNGGAGDDSIDGGAGGDNVSYRSDAAAGVNVNLATGSVSGGAGNDRLANVEHVEDSAFNDTLTGNAENNWFRLGSGNDRADGGAGIDVVMYEDATAAVSISLLGGTASGASVGSDTLTGIEAAHGSGWADTITLGNDVSNGYAFGRAGNDTITGGNTSNVFHGGSGADRLDGGAGSDMVSYAVDSGELVNAKTLSGLGVVVNLATGTARDNWGDTDTLLNLENAEGSVLGDTLTGSAGDNWLAGQGGNDLLDGGAGNDVLDGGAGTDTVSYAAATAAVTASLVTAATQATGGSGNDTLLSIENLTGSAYGDSLTGNAANNQLIGGAGHDTLDGGTGNDTLDGGADNDTYVVDSLGDVVTELAGGGSDLVISSISYSLVDTDGAGASGGYVEHLRLSGSGAINATGNALANILYAGAGDNRLDGGAGTDTVSYLYATAAVTASLGTTSAQLTGGSGSDTLLGIENLTGSAYDDTLTGGIGSNLLQGGAGKDWLNGAAGHDTLVGGSGADVLTGGSDSDVFRFTALTDSGLGDTTRDTVADFVVMQDRIDLAGIDANAAAAGDQPFLNFIAATAAFTTAGQMRFAGNVLYLNTDNDADAEMTIKVLGTSALQLSDFVL